MLNSVGSNSEKWSLIVAANDDAILRRNLLKSPQVEEKCEIIIKQGFSSAGSAYNSGISEATGEILIFAHQDVYLPKGWFEELEVRLEYLTHVDPEWGVVGVYGVSNTLVRTGHIYCTAQKRILGKPFRGCIQCVSLDEVVLILRRSSRLVFDSELAGFHLYGTDICMQASERGMRSYAISAFCIHNTNGIRVLPAGFWRCYLYMRKKWWHRLPLHTCCTTITRTYGPIADHVIRGTWGILRGRKVGMRLRDPNDVYDNLSR